MRSKRKTKPWGSYFTNEQKAIVELVASSKARGAFIWGLVFGFILCAIVSFLMSETIGKYQEDQVVNRAVQERLVNMHEDIDTWESTINKPAKEYNE